MLSVNYKDLEQLRQFAILFEFIQNPDKYVTAIDSVKQTIAEFEKVIGPYNTMEKANNYLDSIKKREGALDGKKKQIERECQELTEKTAKMAAAKKKEMDDSAKILEEKKNKIEEKEQQVNEKEKLVNQRSHQVTLKEEELAVKEKALKELEVTLNSKAEQLKKILG